MKQLRIFSLLILFFLKNTLVVYAQPKYEFRAVWIATIFNIDWPSKKNLSVAQQKSEFIYLLDSLQSLNINAVIVQIRTAADAFYLSEIEPWSEYLNGVQGLPPMPFYDPLKFMISEAHKRNMEFHAWLNPYRAVVDIKNTKIAPTHISHTHPEWFLNYGNKKYFNPGLPEVMQYVTGIVKDIITRYDVDAIHLDDYFYPYRIAGKKFPDNTAYKKFGNGMNKDDWRRGNCDSIIKMIHETILENNPMVKFGISPFAVWRNNSKDPAGSFTEAGITNYDDLYADILLWLKNDWIDYVAPQLYWEIGHKFCDYNTLLNWWSHHTYGRHRYIGHGIYKTAQNPPPAWRRPGEIPNQIKRLRTNINVQGSIYYRCANLLRNPLGWGDSLKNNYYHLPALIPPMPWIDTNAPKPPDIYNFITTDDGRNTGFTFYAKSNDSAETEIIKSYVIYVGDNLATLGSKPFHIIAADTSKIFSFRISTSQIPEYRSTCYISTSSVDKENNESILSNVIELIKTGKGWHILKK